MDQGLYLLLKLINMLQKSIITYWVMLRTLLSETISLSVRIEIVYHSIMLFNFYHLIETEVFEPVFSNILRKGIERP